MSTQTISKPASFEYNRLAARQWIDAFNARDDDREAGARTVDYTAHAPESMQLPRLDSDAWVQFLGAFLEGFPDLHLEVQDAVADDGMTAQRILFTGTHTGPFRGLPPTGREVRFSGIEINRMAGEKITEHWFQLDALTLFQQLGLRVGGKWWSCLMVGSQAWIGRARSTRGRRAGADRGRAPVSSRRARDPGAVCQAAAAQGHTGRARAPGRAVD